MRSGGFVQDREHARRWPRNPSGQEHVYIASEFVVSALKKISSLSLPAIAMLAITLLTTIVIAPSFADASPSYRNTANLPSIGGIDDYMHQQGDGPSTAPSSPRYSPQSLPPRGYAPQGPPPPEWNSGYYADPNTQRNLLIGAAIVGAVAVGMWAYQQHQLHQAQKRARSRRFYGRRYGFIE